MLIFGLTLVLLETCLLQYTCPCYVSTYHAHRNLTIGGANMIGMQLRIELQCNASFCVRLPCFQKSHIPARLDPNFVWLCIHPARRSAMKTGSLSLMSIFIGCRYCFQIRRQSTAICLGFSRSWQTTFHKCHSQQFSASTSMRPKVCSWTDFSMVWIAFQHCWYKYLHLPKQECVHIARYTSTVPDRVAAKGPVPLCPPP